MERAPWAVSIHLTSRAQPKWIMAAGRVDLFVTTPTLRRIKTRHQRDQDTPGCCGTVRSRGQWAAEADGGRWTVDGGRCAVAVVDGSGR